MQQASRVWRRVPKPKPASHRHPRGSSSSPCWVGPDPAPVKKRLLLPSFLACSATAWEAPNAVLKGALALQTPPLFPPQTLRTLSRLPPNSPLRPEGKLVKRRSSCVPGAPSAGDALTPALGGPAPPSQWTRPKSPWWASPSPSFRLELAHLTIAAADHPHSVCRGSGSSLVRAGWRARGWLYYVLKRLCRWEVGEARARERTAPGLLSVTFCLGSRALEESGGGWWWWHNRPVEVATAAAETERKSKGESCLEILFMLCKLNASVSTAQALPNW